LAGTRSPIPCTTRVGTASQTSSPTLSLVTPGGYVAVLTSRYTMDSVKPAARQDIAAQADLIGAVRLPSQAFSRVAGTEVVTDHDLPRAAHRGG
jgi:hypothetical protein